MPSSPYPDGPALGDEPTQPLPPLAPSTRYVVPREASPYYAPPYRPPRAPGMRRSPIKRILITVVVLIVIIAVAGGALGLHRAVDFGRAISPQPPLSVRPGFLSSDRVNLVVLGYGGGTHDGANLTDSLLVISLNPADGSTTLVSVPRDLWVQIPPDSGQYAKLNAAYQDGLQRGYAGEPAGRAAGGDEAAQKVGDVLGLDVPYWLTIDFSGFRGLVDALGGVDITVPTGFTAQYPRNDDPRIDASWKTVTFKPGPQHMNGEQAIEYARARYVLSPASEGSDFARSLRQQLLLRAILDRARQVSAWPRLLGAADALQTSLYTNLSLMELTQFSRALDLTHATRVGLTDQNVLMDAQSDDGQSILLPASGDWNAIRQYVAGQLKP
jgi:polyisoprenyl-teichoic acid--peptidoglycan teichoic acid transferase